MTIIATQLTQLNHLLPTISQQYHRLLLITGPHGSGKTCLLKELSQQDIPYLNVNLYLSQKLLDLTTKERPLRIRRILTQIITDQPESILALDNIELLFEPSLHQDPLVLLQELSRNKSLVVAWGGVYDEQNRVLTYAEPGHPEYRRYERPEVMIFTL
ncbi:MAG: BREX-3 system P-loop-containing protein BrxF [Anaerolineae bacterium]|nr:BREX-3 system P-loop-containing protein BrxF [Anaerolineae bacterium]